MQSLDSRSLLKGGEHPSEGCGGCGTKSQSLPEGAPRPRCAVITPYREQKACVLDKLKDALGPAAAAAVRVDTVDSFQVRQRSEGSHGEEQRSLGGSTAESIDRRPSTAPLAFVTKEAVQGVP